MPYSSVSEVPTYVPKAKRKQWMAVWNSSYSAHGDESRAFAEANAAIKKLFEAFMMKATSDELYEDTGDYDEEAETHLREELIEWANYAEDGPSFDPDGKYLCESCDMRLGEDNCNRVVSPISFTTGGCRIYTYGEEPEDQEPMPQKLTQIEAAYTERPEVKGFGCSRCMFSSEAKTPDSEDRPSWCAFWGLHVIPNACCFKNTGDDDVFAPIKGNTDKTAEKSTMIREAAKAIHTSGDVQIFCPLVKVDEAKREVWGVVTAEEPDKDGEICDYETTVPYYQAVVDEMSKATDGANIFPLRVMHGLTAAGKGISIEFRKDSKEIYMGFKVVDDAEWKKVQENVYTGFSQGGRYVKKWKDGEYMRYTAKPVEVSLVDMPCCTKAHFDYIKADGSIEIRKFAKSEPIGQAVGQIPDTASVPGGDVKPPCTCDCAQCKAGNCKGCTKGATHPVMSGKAVNAVKYLVTDSTGKGHLPYTKEDGKPDNRLMWAAWTALHGGHRVTKNYDGPDKQKAIKRLKQIYAQVGVDTPAEKAERIDAMLKTMIQDVIQNRAYGQLGKGMYTVSRFASLSEDLKYLWMSLEYEREQEGDESPVTDDVKELYMSLLDHLLAYVEEEVEEERSRHVVA